VNVGGVRLVDAGERTVRTAIWKSPVRGRIAVRGVNLSGDDQADRKVHGGADKAVYAYAWEDALWWQGQLGRELEPGNFGENLTLEGVHVPGAVVGERWRVGSALLEVSEPRFPCFKLGLRMGDPRFVKRFARARRTGVYLRIAEPGDVGAGDPIEVVSRPDGGVTIGEFAEAYLGDHSLAHRLLDAPGVAPRWRDWAGKRAARVGDG
jgi:MOSC domain-containing protein YiiM